MRFPPFPPFEHFIVNLLSFYHFYHFIVNLLSFYGAQGDIILKWWKKGESDYCLISAFFIWIFAFTVQYGFVGSMDFSSVLIQDVHLVVAVVGVFVVYCVFLFWLAKFNDFALGQRRIENVVEGKEIWWEVLTFTDSTVVWNKICHCCERTFSLLAF